MIVKHKVQKMVCMNNSVENLIVVDQRAGHPDLLNRFGYPANEITLLEKLQRENPDSPLVNQLERSLMEIPTSQVDNSGLSDSQIIARVIPKYVGTLSEYLAWVDSLPLSENERALLDEQAKQQFNDDDSVDNSTESPDSASS